MKTAAKKPMCLGDVIVAAYDAAERRTKSARRKQQLAARAVRNFLAKAGRLDLARRLNDLQPQGA